MGIPPVQLAAMCDELQKIAGGGIKKALLTDITPGTGPVWRRILQGMGSAKQELVSQVKRHGWKKGLF